PSACWKRWAHSAACSTITCSSPGWKHAANYPKSAPNESEHGYMETAAVARAAVQRSGERAYFDHGWLQTYHSFSFAEYDDPNNRNWGALRVFNDDVIAPGS